MQSSAVRTIRVAIAQAAPVYYNKAASLAKAIDLIRDAASQGAVLVAFGETWFSGYPAWLDVCPTAALWDHEPTKGVFAQLRENSVSLEGPEVCRLANAARDLQIGVIIGVNERVEKGPAQKTLYNSLLTFSPEGRLANHHPKLVPTFTERLVWGPWRRDRSHLRRVRASPCGRFDLLGTLDASCANGNASSRRARSRSRVAHCQRNGATREQALRIRRPMLCACRRLDDADARHPECAAT